MNLFRDISNIILHLLVILDAVYAFVINKKGNIIKKISSDKDLQIYHASVPAVYLDKKADEKIYKPEYIETIEYLDDGEVAWEVPVKIYNLTKDEDKKNENNHQIVETQLVYKPPFNSIVSGIVKGINKEIFRIETFYDIAIGMYASNSNYGFSNIILAAFITFMRYSNGIILSSDIDALKNSYKQTNNLEYMKQYLKFKKYASTAILITMFVLTKNVQVAQ
jgi:hypothetical protein